jgi:hypothetical protein
MKIFIKYFEFIVILFLITSFLSKQAFGDIGCSPGVDYPAPSQITLNENDLENLKLPPFDRQYNILASLENNFELANKYRKQIVEIAEIKLNINDTKKNIIEDNYKNSNLITNAIDELKNQSKQCQNDNSELQKLFIRSTALVLLNEMSTINVDENDLIYKAFLNASDAGVSWIRSRGVLGLKNFPDKISDVVNTLLLRSKSENELCDYVRHDALVSLAKIKPNLPKSLISSISHNLVDIMLHDKSPSVRQEASIVLSEWVVSDKSLTQYQEMNDLLNVSPDSWLRGQTNNVLEAVSILINKISDDKEDRQNVANAISTLLNFTWVPRPIISTIIANAAINEYSKLKLEAPDNIKNFKTNAESRIPINLKKLVEYKSWIIGIILYIFYAIILLLWSYIYPYKLIELSFRIPSIDLNIPIPNFPFRIPVDWLILIHGYQSSSRVLKKWIDNQAFTLFESLKEERINSKISIDQNQIIFRINNEEFPAIDPPSKIKDEITKKSKQLLLIGPNKLTSKAAYRICEYLIKPDHVSVLPSLIVPIVINYLQEQLPENANELSKFIIKKITSQLNLTLNRIDIKEKFVINMLKAGLMIVVFNPRSLNNPYKRAILNLPISDFPARLVIACVEETNEDIDSARFIQITLSE